MEELRIKCPSCGIVLDVRNSRNEAVKRITCPNCKKQLAVTFHDNPQPAQFVNIKTVQLVDGSSKTILQVLTAGHDVKVNDETLQKGDEVVLVAGDKLQLDGTISTWGGNNVENSRQAAAPAPTKPKQEPRMAKEPTPPSPTPSPSRSHWPYYLAALVAVLLLAIVYWKHQPQSTSIVETKRVTVTDTTVKEPVKTKPLPPVGKPAVVKTQRSQPSRTEAPSSSTTDISALSNYELEKLALGGNVEAQYQLGKRWVGRRDSINVVKGIQYLKMAARNGSHEANSALRNVYAALQQSAANGSSTAGNILREQR